MDAPQLQRSVGGMHMPDAGRLLMKTPSGQLNLIRRREQPDDGRLPPMALSPSPLKGLPPAVMRAFSVTPLPGDLPEAFAPGIPTVSMSAAQVRRRRMRRNRKTVERP